MRKILISILCVFIGFSNVAVGENILTTQSFVDSAVTQKQDKIPANNGTPQVLMNTGTDGNVGTKDIYDSTASYGTQTDAIRPHRMAHKRMPWSVPATLTPPCKMQLMRNLFVLNGLMMTQMMNVYWWT